MAAEEKTSDKSGVTLVWTVVVVVLTAMAVMNIVWLILFSVYRDDIRRLEQGIQVMQERVEKCCGPDAERSGIPQHSNSNVLNIEASRTGLTREVLKSWGAISDGNLSGTSSGTDDPAGDDSDAPG